MCICLILHCSRTCFEVIIFKFKQPGICKLNIECRIQSKDKKKESQQNYLDKPSTNFNRGEIFLVYIKINIQILYGNLVKSKFLL